jgi:hypothetical protein
MWCTYSFSWSRIHERTISLRILGISLRVLRLEVSVYNVYKPVSNPFCSGNSKEKTFLPITSKDSASKAAPSNSWQPLKQWRHLRLHNLFGFSGLFSVLLPVTSYLVFPTYLYCIIQDWFNADFIVHIDIHVLRNRKTLFPCTVFYCSYCARKCTLLMLKYCINIEDKLFSLYGICVAGLHSNKIAS